MNGVTVVEPAPKSGLDKALEDVEAICILAECGEFPEKYKSHMHPL